MTEMLKDDLIIYNKFIKLLDFKSNGIIKQTIKNSIRNSPREERHAS
jgi:hypothetical protein